MVYSTWLMCVSGALGAKLSQSIHRNPGSLCIYEVATLCPFHLFANRLYCYSPHGREYTHAVLGPYNATTKRRCQGKKWVFGWRSLVKKTLSKVDDRLCYCPRKLEASKHCGHGQKKNTLKLTVPAILRYSEWNLSTNTVVILAYIRVLPHNIILR